MGARARQALRRVHLLSPLLGRSLGVEPGVCRARYTQPLQKLLQLLQPTLARAPYWARPPLGFSSGQNFVRWISGWKTHNVAERSQLAEPDLAGDAAHLRHLQQPVVRHKVLPPAAEDFAKRAAHKRVQSPPQPLRQRPCFTRVKQDRHDQRGEDSER